MAKKNIIYYEESKSAKRVKHKVDSVDTQIASYLHKKIDMVDQKVQQTVDWIRNNPGKILAGTFFAGIVAGFKLRKKR